MFREERVGKMNIGILFRDLKKLKRLVKVNMLSPLKYKVSRNEPMARFVLKIKAISTILFSNKFFLVNVGKNSYDEITYMVNNSDLELWKIRDNNKVKVE